MNIKKVDDKPMVIHTKEKPKLKVKGAPETKIKGRNVLTVQHGPKIAGSASGKNWWQTAWNTGAEMAAELYIFLNEKKQYDADMEKMEEELAALRQAQKEEETEQQGSERKADQAMAFLEEEELTEDMKEKLIEKLIEKVIVYPGDRIEIVWKFEGRLNN